MLDLAPRGFAAGFAGAVVHFVAGDVGAVVGRRLVHETSSSPSPAFTVNALGASGFWATGVPGVPVATGDQPLKPAELSICTRTW